jgi:outer membrane immunogenic protein
MGRVRTGFVALVAALALGLAGSPAVADGFYGAKGGYRPYSWTGFYIGLNAGLANGQTGADFGLIAGLLNTDYEMSGAVYGGQIGYNWQSGNLVLGIEGTYAGSSLQGSTTCILIFECKREVESVGTVVGRLGVAMDRSLLYAMGGFAWGKVNSDFSIIGITLATDSKDHRGWVAGFGFEHALSNNLSLRLEYSHIDLGSEVHFGAADVDVQMDTVRLGVNYKFN